MTFHGYRVMARQTELGSGYSDGLFYDTINAREAVLQFKAKHPEYKIIEYVMQFYDDGGQRYVPKEEYDY